MKAITHFFLTLTHNAWEPFFPWCKTSKTKFFWIRSWKKNLPRYKNYKINITTEKTEEGLKLSEHYEMEESFLQQTFSNYGRNGIS